MAQKHFVCCFPRRELLVRTGWGVTAASMQADVGGENQEFGAGGGIGLHCEPPREFWQRSAS